MHDLAVYVKERVPFAWYILIFRKLYGFLIMFSTGFSSLSVLLLFPLSITFSVFMHTVFDSISSNIDEVFSINPSANLFVFGDFNAHHKNWLTYFGETDTVDHQTQNGIPCFIV